MPGDQPKLRRHAARCECRHLPAGLTIGAEFTERHRTGRLRLLAHSFNEGRWPLAPEVARFTEQGVDFVGSAWNAFVAPASTPAARCTQLAMPMPAALHLPTAVARLRNLGLEPTGGTPAELCARIQANR